MVVASTRRRSRLRRRGDVGSDTAFDVAVIGIDGAINLPTVGTYYQPMIQTNADINPGNSGGPLLDMSGRVVGIATSLIQVGNGAPAQGLSLAVPIDTPRRVANQLVQYGKVVDCAQVNRVVNSVPAADTGIKAGDVITSFGGAEIYNRDELLQRLVLQHPGDIVPVGVTRAGQALSLNLTLTEIRAP
jgi:putative serine protease PepD